MSSTPGRVDVGALHCVLRRRPAADDVLRLVAEWERDIDEGVGVPNRLLPQLVSLGEWEPTPLAGYESRLRSGEWECHLHLRPDSQPGVIATFHGRRVHGFSSRETLAPSDLEVIASWQELRHVSLVGAELATPLEELLHAEAELETLLLGQAGNPGVLDHWQPPKSLRAMWLGGVDIGRAWAKSLRYCQSLLSLALQHCNLAEGALMRLPASVLELSLFGSRVPPDLGQAPCVGNLRVLVMSEAKIDIETLRRALPVASQLRVLDVRGCPVDENLVALIESLPKLKFLDLDASPELESALTQLRRTRPGILSST